MIDLKWLREILVNVGVAAITLAIFAVALVFGVVVAQLADGNLWVCVAATLGFLILIVLPLRLLWVARTSRKP
jgi:hypothetical protein